MYTNDNCKILNQNYINNYKNAFQEYFIKMFYGSNIVMGSTLVDDEDGK